MTQDAYPPCPACDESELYSLMSYRTIPESADYMQAPTACYACGARFPEPPRWIRETPTCFLVRVSQELQYSAHGLHLAAGMIPFDDRRGKTAQFVDEVQAGRYRWWRLTLLELKV